MIPRSLNQLPGRRPRTRWGRPLRFRHGRSRRFARDPSRHSSDTVWALVEKMLAGDADAAVVLSDVLDEGVSSGKTRFIKITEKARRWHGKTIPEKIREGEFAAITPGRQIVLFGVRKRLMPGNRTYEYKGYMSRYSMGDSAEYDSYNLVYFGEIIGITAKQVTIDKNARFRQRHAVTGESMRYPVSKAVLSIERFSYKNWDPNNLQQGLERNRNWSD